MHETTSDAHETLINPSVQFVEAWEANYPIVFRVCLAKLGGSRDDAEEAYSRVAVQAFQKWPLRLHDSEHATAWLLTVARNVCMDLHRERRRNREVSLDTSVEVLAENLTFASPARFDPEQMLVAEERWRRVRVCLRRLPSRLRVATEMHFFRDMPYGDVARELGISEVNVRKRIQQARVLLRHGIDAVPARQVAIEHEVPAGTHVERGATTVLHALLVTTDGGVEHDVVLSLPLVTRRFETLERYIRQYPTGSRKRLEIARLLAMRGAWEEAIHHYRFVLAKQPFPLQPWIELGTLFEGLGRFDDAASTYREGASKAGRGADRLHLRALGHAVLGWYDAACEALRRAIAEAPGDPRHARALGAICLAAGWPGDAAAALECCLDTTPADPLVPLLWHDAVMATSRPGAARKRLTCAESGNINVPAIERCIAMLCRGGLGSASDIDVAEALLLRLQRAAPERAGTHAAAALTALARGRGGEAETILCRYLDRHPRHQEGWLWLARVRQTLGHAATAEAAALKAIQLDASNRDAWIELCRVMGWRGASAESAGVIAEVQRRFHSDAVVLSEAGRMASEVGNVQQADAFWREAIRIQPRVARFYILRGRALFDEGMLTEAVAPLLAAWALLAADDGHEDASIVASLMARTFHGLGAVAEQRAWGRVALTRGAALEAIDRPAAKRRQAEVLDASDDKFTT